MATSSSIARGRIGGVVYVIPNLFTTGNLFFGYFAIMKSLTGDFALAAGAIFLAAVFDALDGRVARLTGGTSEFGVQYDSLCDLVSFGLAPAFMMFQFGLHQLGRIGWVICFLFLACGALRLARFNVLSSVGKASGDFTGLPIPMAGGMIAAYVAFMTDLERNQGQYFHVLDEIYGVLGEESVRLACLAVGGVLLALAMVSNIAYRSAKTVHIRAIKPFRLLVLLVLVLTCVAYQPEVFGFGFMLLYVVSGPVEWVLGWKKSADEDEIFATPPAGESALDTRYN